MKNPSLITSPTRYAVKREVDYILSTMTLQTAINLTYTRLTNYRDQGAMINFSFYKEVHTYLESLAINN